MRRISSGLGFLALLVATGCASTGEAEGSRGSGDVITAEQLATIHVSTAYEAISRLRPQFLRQRGTTTIRNAGPEGQPTGMAAQTGTELVVYVDGVRVGGVEALHSIGVDSVHEIRRLSGRDATTVYGTGHPGGVIEVRTKQ